MKEAYEKLVKILVFLMLSILTFTFIYPLYYMIINSIKTQKQYLVDPFGLPKGALQLDNFSTMVSQFNIFKFFNNTAYITIFSVMLVIFFSTFAGYAFAKLRFPCKSIHYILIIGTMFIPVQVTLIPIYVMFSKTGLINNLWSVILVYIASLLPSTILLLTSNFRGIPNELIEACKIDGCNYFGIIRNVILPMGLPVITVSIIFAFIFSWNDLFTPMILLQGDNTQTLMVALTNLVSRFSRDYPFQMAGLIFGALPVILVYIFLQSFMVEGMTAGAIKQ